MKRIRYLDKKVFILPDLPIVYGKWAMLSGSPQITVAALALFCSSGLLSQNIQAATPYSAFAQMGIEKTASDGTLDNMSQTDGGDNLASAHVGIQEGPGVDPNQSLACLPYPYICPSNKAEAVANMGTGHLGASVTAWSASDSNLTSTHSYNTASAWMDTIFQVITPANTKGQFFSIQASSVLDGTLDGTEGTAIGGVSAYLAPSLIPDIYAANGAAYTDPHQLDWYRKVDPTGTYVNGINTKINDSSVLNINETFPISLSGFNYDAAGVDTSQMPIFGGVLPGAASAQTWQIDLFSSIDAEAYAYGSATVTADLLNSFNLSLSYDPKLQVTALSGSFPGVSSGPSPISSVPLPAAAWLFGSGLISLIGIARRKRANI
jgi:hypothetical protein